MRGLASLFDSGLHISPTLQGLSCAKTPEAWKAYIADIELRMHDEAFVQGFQKLCPVDGAEAADYNYRLHQLEELAFVSSIRFAGLSLEEPFVEILLSSKPLDEDLLRLMTKVLIGEYAKFKPKRLRYFSPNDRAIFAEDREDFAFFIENTSTIQHCTRPARFDEIQIRPATSLEFYPDLVRIYEELKDENLGTLNPEPPTSLDLSLKQGLLFEAFIEGQWAGMISAQRMTERFYSGIYIVEEVLDKKYRGQRYAPAMQRKFIDQLEADQLVFGEILWWNERSRRTAMRVGRKKCGTTFSHSIANT
jgi:RimJ/RimL family protein N-acetyltransferase